MSVSFVSPRVKYEKKRDKENAKTFYDLQIIFFLASIPIEMMDLSVGGLYLLAVFHGSFFALSLLESFSDFWWKPSLKSIGFFRLATCSIYYTYKCLKNRFVHYEYTMMVLFVHSTITLPSFSHPVTVLSMLGTLFIGFLTFRIVNYTSSDFYDQDENSLLRKLNHTIFDLAPFGVMFFNGLNMDFRKLLHDLTEQMSNSRLNQNRFIEKFAHCCRTCMNGVKTFLIHIKHLNQKAENLETIDLIEEGSEQTINLINDLVDFHELKVKKLSLNESEGNLRNSIERVIKINEEVKSRNPKLELRWKIENTVPERAVFDSVRFSQVMNNLLSNAIKYTEDGEVSVLSYCEDINRFVFCVVDNGPGIPKDKLGDIFTPFSTINRSSKPSLGLGLVISKEICMLMNEGDIKIESEGTGKGVKASFSCRLGKAQAITSRSTSCCPDSPAQFKREDQDYLPTRRPSASWEEKFPLGVIDKNLRVLVVEDVVTNRAVIGLMLSKFGVEDVDFTENGLDALEVVYDRCAAMNNKNRSRSGEEEEEEPKLSEKQIPYDIVLMDINMPKMDGIKCTKELRKNWTSDELPIFAVTAKTFTREEKVTFKESFNGVIRKPVKPEEVFEELRIISRSSKKQGKRKRKRKKKPREGQKGAGLPNKTKIATEGDVVEVDDEKRRIHEVTRALGVVVNVFEKVSLISIATLVFYLIAFASREVFERTFLVFTICASSHLAFMSRKIFTTFVVPFAGFCAIHVFLGPYCHSIRLFFLANSVSRAVLYFKNKSYYKPFSVLIFCFLSAAFFEFTDFYDYICTSELSRYRYFKKLSEKSINVDLMRINIIFDVLYVSQIIINMVKLVVRRKQGDKAMLDVISMLEDDLVLQDNFSAKISHDLRAPIFACIFLLKKLERDFSNYSFFHKLRLCLYDLKREVDNLVDHYRLKHNKLTINNESIPLRELITNCVNENIDVYKHTTGCDLFLNRFMGDGSVKKKKKKSNALTFVYRSSELPRVAYGDKDRIELVMNNLISNAVVHTKKGVIEISTSFVNNKNGEGLLFTVSDTGGGIPDEMLKGIFNKERKKKKKLWEEMNSLGLGLVTHKETLKRMGGSLTVVSKIGEGTRMEAFFPIKAEKGVEELEVRNLNALRRKSISFDLDESGRSNEEMMEKIFGEKEEEEVEGEDDDDEDEDEAEAENEEEGEGDQQQPRNEFQLRNPLKIAVVEDNVVCMRMMKYYLETSLGYEGKVLYAATGKKALDIVTEEDVELCFVDFFLPDYTAFDLINDIRNVKGNMKTEFCLCSGNIFDSSVVDEEDIMKLLYKPVRLESIKLVITEFCSKKRLKK